MQQNLTETFKVNVRYLRGVKNWTQEELNEKSNVSIQEISKIESGKVIPSLDIVERICFGFGESWRVLLDPHLSIQNLRLSPNLPEDKLTINLRDVSKEDRLRIINAIEDMVEIAREKGRGCGDK